MADPVSSTRLYIGNLPRDVTKEEIENHFNNHGTGTIKEIKVMNGFGFIEYQDAADARDVVPACHGTELKDSRLTVQFARGQRRKDEYGPQERSVPRPRRTIYRMQITGLHPDTSWQDLKDFARSTGQLDVVYSETGRGDDKGFVEFENSGDLKTAVQKCDGQQFKGNVLHCVEDIQEERDARSYRQRSPPPTRGRYGPPEDYYDRRGPPPRGYSPRGGYRERSPGRRPPPIDDYYDRGYRRSPPRDYGPPPTRRYDEPYDNRGPPPPPVRGYSDPYARNGDPYAPRRSSPPPRGYGYGGGYGGYDERRYWSV